MRTGPRRTAPWAIVLLAAVGCSPGGVDTTYGRSRGTSINGTGALAELFRQQGHTVRVARRLNDTVGQQADTIVRFAPLPGLPDRDEAQWYHTWNTGAAGRRLIYILRDFDAESEYWAEALAHLPAGADPLMRSRMERQRDARQAWVADLPPPAKSPADPSQWFGLAPSPGSPVLCQKLSGPWAEGIDPGAAALTRHQAFQLDEDASETVLLEGDGQPLVLEWQWYGAGSDAVLVVANGSFLLNEPLVHRARRPLAQRVLRWAGETPRRVVFVEGENPLAEGEHRPSRWPPPLDWIMPHLLAFGLVACLSRAVVLGRLRPEPPSGADRPAAHAEALGDLLSKTRDAEAARSLLESYRRWRHPTTHLGTARGPRR